MPRWIQMKPRTAVHSMTRGIDIGRHQGETPAGLQDPAALLEEANRFVNMFDHMTHGHRVKQILWILQLVQGFSPYLEDLRLAVLHCHRPGVYSFTLPAQSGTARLHLPRASA